MDVEILPLLEFARTKSGTQKAAGTPKVGNHKVGKGVRIGLTPRVEPDVLVDPLDVGFWGAQGGRILLKTREIEKSQPYFQMTSLPRGVRGGVV